MGPLRGSHGRGYGTAGGARPCDTDGDAAAARPGAKRLLDGVPHTRGTASGALIADGGLAALECSVTRRLRAGDHFLVIACVVAVPYVAASGEPLIRFRGRYPGLR